MTLVILALLAQEPELRLNRPVTAAQCVQHGGALEIIELAPYTRRLFCLHRETYYPVMG